LFDLNKATLRSGAQLRLAKVAGIILAYPDLKLEIDGFTDNTGTPQYNQTLSDKRAEAVKNFLVSQGVAPDAVTTKGYGESNPVASNATASGRQMNRRVELVVSGSAIGSNVAPGTGIAPTATGTTAPSNPSMQSSGANAAAPNSSQPSAPSPGNVSSPVNQPAPAAPANANTTATPADTGSQPGNINPPSTGRVAPTPSTEQSPQTAPAPNPTPPPS
jgi:hypothetical protein